MSAPSPFMHRTLYRTLHLLLLSLCLAMLTACSAESLPLPTPIATFSPAPTVASTPTITVVAEGLLGPIGLAALPDGSLLVAEEGTGGRDDSAGVSLIDARGRIGPLHLRPAQHPRFRRSGRRPAGQPCARWPDALRRQFWPGPSVDVDLPADQLANGFALPPTPYTPDDTGQGHAARSTTSCWSTPST